jgi:hypothetical protein
MKIIKNILIITAFITFAGAQKIEVQLFYSKNCEHCQRVLQNFLPKYEEMYKDQIFFNKFEIDENMQNYELLLKKETALGVKAEDPVPSIFIGNEYINSEEEIYKKLPKALERLVKSNTNASYLKPIKQNPQNAETVIVVKDTVPSTDTAKQIDTVYAMFFFKKGCSHCARINFDIKLLLEKAVPNFGVQLVINSYDIADSASKLLNEALCERYGVEETHRMATPSVFFDSIPLIYAYNELNYFTLATAVKKFPHGSRKLWETITQPEIQAAEKRIETRFSKFNAAPIVAAGLLDGINPCAFGALIFLITFLKVAERKRGEILAVGIVYTLAVFLTYYGVGVGFLKFLASLAFFKVIAKWVYILTCVLAVVLGILSIVDFFKARSGKLKDMTLQLPEKLKKKIHRIIISENEPRMKRNFLIAAFITGFFVSLLELACTGQVYLPTIIYVLGIPSLRMKAHLYLLLYNFMFIVPLLVVFLISYFGATSDQLNGFLKKNTSVIKLLTALMFFGMAALLLRSIIG